MNRRGQLGATLTWFVAFIVVFFAMLLFVGGSVALAKVKVLNLDKNEIGFGQIGFEGLKHQREVMGILNTRVENERVGDLILKWKEGLVSEERVKEVLKIVLDSKEKNCPYLFGINPSQKDMVWISRDLDEGVYYLGNPEDSPNMFLFELNEEIKIGYTKGKCDE